MQRKNMGMTSPPSNLLEITGSRIQEPQWDIRQNSMLKLQRHPGVLHSKIQEYVKIKLLQVLHRPLNKFPIRG